MGLLGHLYVGLYHPGTVTYIRPEDFVVQPSLWLQTLSRYRGIVSGAPDFAYGLCLSKIRDRDLQGVDLSSWRIAFNGAEPICTDTMRAFSDRFARFGFRPEAMTPVYGLAEAGLAVSFSDPRTAPLVSEFDRERLSVRGEAVPGRDDGSSLGRPVPGLDIAIRDEGGCTLAEGRVGRITVKGPSITPGYYGNAELSRRTLREGWLDTGDLGFLLGGELYVCGRLKDLIIIRGRNFAPQEVEELLSGVSGLRAGAAWR
jgi:acyl-CoA synthetase (AMP-forming)/AMP-acid ligase II